MFILTRLLCFALFMSCSISVFACQSPVGTWNILNEEEPSVLVFSEDGSGEFAYALGEAKYKEDISWTIVTDKERPSTEKNDSKDYQYETNVIEVIYYTNYPDVEGSSIEYLLCTDDRLVGQIKSIHFDNDVYMYKKSL